MLKNCSGFFKSAGKSYAEGKNIARNVQMNICDGYFEFCFFIVTRVEYF